MITSLERQPIRQEPVPEPSAPWYAWAIVIGFAFVLPAIGVARTGKYAHKGR